MRTTRLHQRPKDRPKHEIAPATIALTVLLPAIVLAASPARAQPDPCTTTT